jgi:hypothetical protein
VYPPQLLEKATDDADFLKSEGRVWVILVRLESSLSLLLTPLRLIFRP